MEFGQLIEYNIKTFFLKNEAPNMVKTSMSGTNLPASFSVQLLKKNTSVVIFC